MSENDVSGLMQCHGIERVVLVPAQQFDGFAVPGEFHAWRFDNHMECGIGKTVQEAIANAVRLERLAA